MDQSLIRTFEINDFLIELCKSENRPHSEYWTKQEHSHLFASNIMETANNILRDIYHINKLVPARNRNNYSAGITINEYCNFISSMLICLGFNGQMPLTGKKLETSLPTFRKGIQTLIQECCPDNKQHHIFGKKIYGGNKRKDPLQSSYRDNLFYSPDSWNWLNQDVNRWLPTSIRSPSFVRFIGVSVERELYCLVQRDKIISLNKNAHLGQRVHFRM